MTRILIFLVTILTGALFAQEVPQNLELSAVESSAYDQDLLPATFHQGRREALREALPVGGVAVVFANPIRNRSNDIDFEYHQDPNFFYLTGLNEPNAVILVFKEPREIQGKTINELVVLQERDPAMEIWNGKRIGVQGAEVDLGIQAAMTGAQFMAWNPTWTAADKLFMQTTTENLVDKKHDKADLSDLIQHFQANTGASSLAPNKDLQDIMARLREVKLPEELELMKKAIDITCMAQNELMAKLRPEMTEYQTEAIVEYVFKSNGAEDEGFPSIQGGGPHSCVLHYLTNRRTLGENDLLVSDIGAEYHGYTADVTRTLPVKGTFSKEQKIIYDLVLKAQDSGIAEVRAGNAFHAAHRAATDVIATGLKALGLIKDEEDVRRYFMHGTSHYLGLDVHDAGMYGALVVGNVITVEPGIYIAEGSACDPKWWNIGVRIEDDILVTEGDPVNLSAASPRTTEAIEAMMAR